MGFLDRIKEKAEATLAAERAPEENAARSKLIAFRPAAEAFAAGDAVSGEIEIDPALDCQKLSVSLAYMGMSDEGLGQRRTVAGPLELAPASGPIPFVLPLPYAALPYTEITWRTGPRGEKPVLGREPAKIWTAVLIDVEGAQGVTSARRRIGVDPGRSVAAVPGATVNGDGVQLTPGASEVRRGDVIEAAVVAERSVDGLEVGLVGKAKMYTTTDHSGQDSSGWLTLLDLQDFVPLTGSGTYRFTVPAGEPPSFDPNEKVQVQWALVVRKPVRLLPDTVLARAPVRVLA